MSRWIVAALVFLAASSGAAAQTAVTQGGTWTQGHPLMYSSPTGARPVAQDPGAAGGGAAGYGISELLQVNRGTGSAPYAGTGTGPLGAHTCLYDGPTTATAGYHYLCLDANANGGGLLDYGYGGAASSLPFTFMLNGAPASLIAGPGVTITGTFPNQKISVAGIGTGTVQSVGASFMSATTRAANTG